MSVQTLALKFNLKDMDITNVLNKYSAQREKWGLEEQERNILASYSDGRQLIRIGIDQYDMVIRMTKEKCNVILSISLTQSLLDELNEVLVQDKYIYVNKSEFIRNALQKELKRVKGE